jgi:hypothetical protein
MHFNQLLEMSGVAPTGTLVMRHRPWERKLRPIIARMAQEQRHLFDTYQSIQGERVSKSIRKAHHVAAMLALEGNSAVFVGLYKMEGYSTRTQNELNASPEVKALVQLGMLEPKSQNTHWHDLKLTDHLAPFRFSLSVRWPGAAVGWVRWASRNVFEILPLPVVEAIRPDMPPWDELDLRWGELDNLPSSWQAKLRAWRGVYCIFDIEIKKAYIGAAYGEENLLGRWRNYASSGHGDNKLLRERDPENFLFSILQLVSPVAESNEVQELETSWKRRLHTRAPYGLNEN